MLSIACCDILCAVLLSVIYVYMFMSVLKAHKSLCYLLLNMPTLNKAYCIVLYCIAVHFEIMYHVLIDMWKANMLMNALIQVGLLMNIQKYMWTKFEFQVRSQENPRGWVLDSPLAVQSKWPIQEMFQIYTNLGLVCKVPYWYSDRGNLLVCADDGLPRQLSTGVCMARFQ